MAVLHQTESSLIFGAHGLWDRFAQLIRIRMSGHLPEQKDQKQMHSIHLYLHVGFDYLSIALSHHSLGETS